MTDNEQIWSILREVNDPEIPVLSITDLGIVRSVKTTGEQVEVQITPTYSGCPAMDAIALDIRLKLVEHGFRDVLVELVLAPAWTTDWMSDAGKEKLKAYGIAPPNPRQLVCDTQLFSEAEAVQCPRCNSYHTRLVSRFGSTPCKAFYQCNDCLEPFDHFKCH